MIVKKTKNGISSVIAVLEENPVPFYYYILSFWSIILLRILIEIFTDTDAQKIITPGMVIHFSLFYIFLAIAGIIIFHHTTGIPTGKVSRVILPGFAIILLGPLFDLMISWGAGFNMSYLTPRLHGNLLYRFFAFGGPLGKHGGITPGMKIEVAVILLLSFAYFRIKKTGIIKSIVTAVILYCIIFACAVMPFIGKALLNAFNLEYKYSERLFINIYFLLILISIPYLFFLFNKTFFKEILKDIRIFRALHYELMFVLGIAVTAIVASKTIIFDTDNIFHFIFIPAAILFAGIAALITNNIEDKDIDRISNPNRPSVTKTIPHKDYALIAIVSMLLSCIYAAAAGYIMLFFVLIFSGNYFLFSMPPFRLKRVPILSKLLISGNSLMLVLAGYYYILRDFRDFPFSVTLLFIIGITAVVNFIDIKDYEGDKNAGILTLPVIAGIKNSKMIIGTAFFLVYVSTYFVFKNTYLLAGAAGTGFVQYLLVNRAKYNEKPVFIVYLISLFSIIIYIFIFYS